MCCLDQASVSSSPKRPGEWNPLQPGREKCLFLRAAFKKDLLLHVLLRVSLESREFSKVCLLLKLVFYGDGSEFSFIKILSIN